jgi:hypothetical protein
VSLLLLPVTVPSSIDVEILGLVYSVETDYGPAHNLDVVAQDLEHRDEQRERGSHRDADPDLSSDRSPPLP